MTKRTIPPKIISFYDEARNNYIHSSHISCIFICCSCTEQILKQEYVLNRKDKNRAERELKGLITLNKKGKKRVNYIYFGELVERCKKISSLKGSIRKFKKIAKIRNIIAHSLYVDNYSHKDSTQDTLRKNRAFVRDIRNLEKYTDRTFVRCIENIKIGYPDRINGTNIKQKVGEILKDRRPIDKATYVWDIFFDLLSTRLALETILCLKSILVRVYGAKNS